MSLSDPTAESPNNGAAGKGAIALLFQIVRARLALPEHCREAG
jgi:hypothetical protein